MNSTKAQHQYTLAKWAALIREQQASTLKLKDWLAENNLNKDTYYYWKRKLKDEALDSIMPSFVELPTLSQRQEVVPVVKLVQPTQPDNDTHTPTIVASVSLGRATINLYDNASPVFIEKLLEVITNA